MEYLHVGSIIRCLFNTIVFKLEIDIRINLLPKLYYLLANITRHTAIAKVLRSKILVIKSMNPDYFVKIG